MRRSFLAVPAGLFGLLLAAPALAQSVWIVDDGGGAGVDFTDIPAAVAAAGEGDVIVVRDGRYHEFTIIAKSLTVAADAGHHPIVSETSLGNGTGNAVVRVFDLSAGQEVAVRGLELGGTYHQLFSRTPYIQLQNNAGQIWIEDIKLGPVSFRAFDGIEAVNCSAVTVSRSALTALCQPSPLATFVQSSNAVDAMGSNLTLWDCEIVGGEGVPGFNGLPLHGGNGIQIDGGTLFAAGCTVTGGRGGGGVNFSVGGAGGDGLVVSGNALVRLRDCELTGGAGGVGTIGSGPNGEASVVVSGALLSVPGTARSLELTSPARSGVDTVTETYAGEPGDLVYLLWSYTGQMPPLFLGIQHGSIVIDLTTLDGQAVGAIGPSGTLVVSVPPLTLVGLESASLACQATFFQAGNGFFLSSPSLFTLLGTGF